MADKSCPLGDNCDMTIAYMAGYERGSDAIRQQVAELTAALHAAINSPKGIVPPEAEPFYVARR